MAALYDGRFPARGGRIEALEGNWSPKRVVILEFPSMAQAQAWSDSPEYAPAKLLRQRSAGSNMVMVAGFMPV